MMKRGVFNRQWRKMGAEDAERAYRTIARSPRAPAQIGEIRERMFGFADKGSNPRAYKAGYIRFERNKGMQDLMAGNAKRFINDWPLVNRNKLVRSFGGIKNTLEPAKSSSLHRTLQEYGPEQAYGQYKQNLGGVLEKMGPVRRRMMRNILKALR